MTHACFQPEQLIENYPRGREFLLEPFKRFGPTQTINWFEKRSVKIVKESDGRMFPQSNTSQSIIDCLMEPVNTGKIDLRLSTTVKHFKFENKHWTIEIDKQENLVCKNLLIATGSDKHIWTSLAEMGFKIIPAAPSLFTFHINDKELHSLSGTSFTNIQVKFENTSIKAPALITHWGASGPAILKLSAFEALRLNELNYQFKFEIDWLPEYMENELIDFFKKQMLENPKKKLSSIAPFDLTQRFWKFILDKAGIKEFQNWSETGKKQQTEILKNLKKAKWDVSGKSTFKDEFVTAGGVELNEINAETYASNRFPNLYFAGEILNIDAITGGFNFQAAWTAGWHVAQNL